MHAMTYSACRAYGDRSEPLGPCRDCSQLKAGSYQQLVKIAITRKDLTSMDANLSPSVGRLIPHNARKVRNARVFDK